MKSKTIFNPSHLSPFTSKPFFCWEYRAEYLLKRAMAIFLVLIFNLSDRHDKSSSSLNLDVFLANSETSRKETAAKKRSASHRRLSSKCGFLNNLQISSKMSVRVSLFMSCSSSTRELTKRWSSASKFSWSLEPLSSSPKAFGFTSSWYSLVVAWECFRRPWRAVSMAILVLSVACLAIKFSMVASVISAFLCSKLFLFFTWVLRFSKKVSERRTGIWSATTQGSRISKSSMAKNFRS
mmetsp:Transcript_6255/g.38900  ORF Transcript_6255/g.38900 Transcript_6255/m.38900 type:complete len:238 (-) Transcript_6255:1339-2052(-)